MTPIAAKILSVDKLRDQYLITVRVGCETYRGTFDGLNFGENEPHFGSYRYGWLELVYLQNPGLTSVIRVTLTSLTDWFLKCYYREPEAAFAPLSAQPLASQAP
jgi:hypothetical protein